MLYIKNFDSYLQNYFQLKENKGLMHNTTYFKISSNFLRIVFLRLETCISVVSKKNVSSCESERYPRT